MDEDWRKSTCAEIALLNSCWGWGAKEYIAVEFRDDITNAIDAALSEGGQIANVPRALIMIGSSTLRPSVMKLLPISPTQQVLCAARMCSSFALTIICFRSASLDWHPTRS